MKGVFYSRRRQSILYSDDGMTIMELLVASLLGLVIISMTLAATLANHHLYNYDLGRSRVNQNLRSALTIIGGDIRQAGERLPSAFTAVEIINGVDGNPDELILRRNVVDAVLAVCEDLIAGDAPTRIFISSTDEDASPACVFGAQALALASWKEKRLAEQNETLRAYIFNLSTGQGEFFNYTGENDSLGTAYIECQTDALSDDYPANSAAIYLIDQLHYRLSSNEGEADILQVIENEDEDNPQSIVFGVQDIQLRAILNDDSVLDSFDAEDDWTQIKSVEISLVGREVWGREEVEESLSGRFFPRNILSN